MIIIYNNRNFFFFILINKYISAGLTSIISQRNPLLMQNKNL